MSAKWAKTGKLSVSPTSVATLETRARACAEVSLTGRHLVVVGSGAVAQHVFHLQELVGAVTSDDGESESLGALLQRRVVHLALQLAGVCSEARRTSLSCTRTKCTLEPVLFLFLKKWMPPTGRKGQQGGMKQQTQARTQCSRRQEDTAEWWLSTASGK